MIMPKHEGPDPSPPQPPAARREIGTADGRGPVEKTDLTLGIIPLTDCAPIAVAVEKGFFRAQGLQVTTSREASWASIRDKVAYGVLDGAHMIAPMTLATTLGVGGVRCHTVTAINLDLNGNAITVSDELYQRMREADPEGAPHAPLTARALRRVIDRARAAGDPPLTFGIVFPISTHNYELRYWMASAGIDPDHDVNLIVIPPPKMVDAMKDGRISGFCVGEPWNSVAVHEGIGRVLITKHELWNNSPEKVLGVTRDWADAHPNTHLALIRALIEACRWIDEPGNRHVVAQILSAPQYVGVASGLIEQSMTGTFRYACDEPPRPMPDFNVFHRYAANFPWPSHAAWFLTQMLRWGQINQSIDVAATAASVYRPDIYRLATRQLGLSAPLADGKDENQHATPWLTPGTADPITMGPDLVFDATVYDHDRPIAYLDAFQVKQVAVPMRQLELVNP